MGKVTYKVSIDLKKNCHTRLLLGAIRGENRSRRIEVTLTEGGKPFNCADTVSATVYVLKPNQNLPSVNAATIENNVIYYDILGSDVDTVGIVQFQLKLNETVNGNTVTLISTTFEAEVDGSIVNDSGVPSQPTYTALDTALAQVSVARATFLEEVPKVEAMLEREDEVLDACEDYRDEAKAYSESAETSSTSAESYKNETVSYYNYITTHKEDLRGPKGDSGVYYGTTEPTDGSTVWINPSGTDRALITTSDLDGTTVYVGADKKVHSSGGGVGSVSWGSISGDITNQTDLQSALNTKITQTDMQTFYTSHKSELKGDKGDKGDDGDDYVLTDTDKLEIANIVLGLLPSAESVSV